MQAAAATASTQREIDTYALQAPLVCGSRAAAMSSRLATRPYPDAAVIARPGAAT
jgi:hypothetical protein